MTKIVHPVDSGALHPCYLVAVSSKVDIAGLGANITYQPPGMFSGGKVLLNGQPAPKGGKRGTVLVPAADGTQIEAKLQHSFTQASLEVNGVKHALGPKVHTGLMVVAALPLGLIAVGGLLGGLCGGAAFGVNSSIARSDLNPALKIAAMLAVGCAAAVLYFLVAVAVRGAIG